MENKREAKKVDPVRLQALRDLPVEVIKSLTKEEMNSFLFKDEWPDSLQEKLKDYLVDE
ncbi:MAG: hypothetical protein WC769_03585 [Thermodesulfovibrionales bacterium]|jgi:hypothetical protein